MESAWRNWVDLQEETGVRIHHREVIPKAKCFSSAIFLDPALLTAFQVKNWV